MDDVERKQECDTEFENCMLHENESQLLRQVTHEQPYPLLFVTVSGAHLYGFPSPDSDYDPRGVHVLPVKEVVGLGSPRETIESGKIREGREIDLVTHDARKFFLLMLKKNGDVLEQLYSPLVVRTTPEHEELKSIARGCITRNHVHHYRGFAETQRGLFRKENPPHVKPLLYLYRVLLTGIHLMRTGEVEANLVRLCECACDDAALRKVIMELIERKLAGPEQSVLADASLASYESWYQQLLAQLEAASASSHLPAAPTAQPALNDLLIRLRMQWGL